MKNLDKYNSDVNLEVGRVCGSTTNFLLDIDSACFFLIFTYIATGLSVEAIAAPNNSVSRPINPGLEDMQAKKIYKRFMKTK